MQLPLKKLLFILVEVYLFKIFIFCFTLRFCGYKYVWRNKISIESRGSDYIIKRTKFVGVGGSFLSSVKAATSKALHIIDPRSYMPLLCRQTSISHWNATFRLAPLFGFYVVNIQITWLIPRYFTSNCMEDWQIIVQSNTVTES